MSRKNDKRSRLIEAADELIYQQTFNSTTLADIATRASVPLGNVYYYFKTKDDILLAVLHKRSSALQSQFNHWEQQIAQPKARLQALIQDAVTDTQTKAKFGCVLGSLCQELSKQAGDLSPMAAELMHKILNWVEAQFKQMGKSPEQAEMLAKHLVASLQGATLLTLTFKNPQMVEKQSKQLESWLNAA